MEHDEKKMLESKGWSALTRAFIGTMLCILTVLPCVLASEETVKPEGYQLAPGETWQYQKNNVEGDVVQINPARIVVEYKVKEGAVREVQLNLGKEDEIQFRHLRGLGDIYPGDKVQVSYFDKFVANEEGQFSHYTRTVTAIALLRSATRSGALSS